jgi:hypothetical protein
VHPDNSDAWEVYQLAGSDPNGIGITGVVEVCKILKVEDLKECLFKVLRIVQTLESKSSAVKKPSPKEEPPIGR